MQNLGKIILFLLVIQHVAFAKPDFMLTLQTTHTKVYVGEPFDVTLEFEEKNDVHAVDSEFFIPTFKGFWIKKESKPKKVKKEKYSTTKIIYTIAAQRVGDLRVSKAEIRIAKNIQVPDKWGDLASQKQWSEYFSNELHVEAIALPSGVDLVGEFSIVSKVKKLEINAGEALSVTVEVRSDGNLEDIKNFNPTIEGLNILSGDTVIDGDTLTQKIIFIAENDFVIAPFVLKYFDPSVKRIKTLATKELHVKVKNAKLKEELIIKSEEKEMGIEDENILMSFDLNMIIVYVLGLISGILLILFKPYNFTRKQKSVSLKEPKTLLIKLLPYLDDSKVQSIIDSLEKNIYTDAKVEVDKKVLKDVVEKYEILL